jgi:hypothetical protein
MLVPKSTFVAILRWRVAIQSHPGIHSEPFLYVSFRIADPVASSPPAFGLGRSLVSSSGAGSAPNPANSAVIGLR